MITLTRVGEIERCSDVLESSSKVEASTNGRIKKEIRYEPRPLKMWNGLNFNIDHHRQWMLRENLYRNHSHSQKSLALLSPKIPQWKWEESTSQKCLWTQTLLPLGTSCRECQKIPWLRAIGTIWTQTGFMFFSQEWAL